MSKPLKELLERASDYRHVNGAALEMARRLRKLDELPRDKALADATYRCGWSDAIDAVHRIIEGEI